MQSTARNFETEKVSPANAHGALVALDVSRVALIVAAATTALMLGDTQLAHVLEGWPDWLLAISALTTSLLVFQFARLWLIWQRYMPVLDSTSANANKKRRTAHISLFELFAYFILVLFSLAAVAFLSTSDGTFGANVVHLVRERENVANPTHIGVFLALFAVSFIPLITAFYLQARYEANSRPNYVFRDDVISPSSLMVICGVIGLIGLLAWAAAGQLFKMNENFGVLVTFVVILAFLATILAPHIARLWNNHSEEQDAALNGASRDSLFILDEPAKIVSRIDSLLVRLIAPVSGATQKGAGLPHFLLIAVMVPLSALGYVLASPYGLIPIGVAMLIALSLGRRWAWLEEDRETASRLQSTQGNDIHIGFENDLKDEALLGYASLFILVPLALNQLQEWTGSFVRTGPTSGNAFVDWLRFFGAELAKAVPFVDWWEIYSVKVETPFGAADTGPPLAKHLTFAARAMVDLVIMSALLQAIGIWQRSRAQHRLYDSGQLDFFDPFTEASFFETGMQSGGKRLEPKTKFLKRIEAHVEGRRAQGMAPLPYNQRRLAELINDRNADVSGGARWMIEKYGVLAGIPREQLAQLSPRWALFKLPQLVALGTPEALEIVRAEKLEFERIVTALGHEAKEKPGTVTDDDIGLLLGLLHETKGSPEFGYAQTLTYELFGRLLTPMAVFALALHVLRTQHYNSPRGWKARIESAMGIVISLNLGQAEARMRVYDALGHIGQNRRAERTTRLLSLELLEWMALPDGDGANSGRAKALECAEAVKQSLGLESDPAPPPPSA